MYLLLNIGLARCLKKKEIRISYKCDEPKISSGSRNCPSPHAGDTLYIRSALFSRGY